MNVIIDQLIIFLQDLRGAGGIMQVMTLATIPSLFAALFLIPALARMRHASALVKQEERKVAQAQAQVERERAVAALARRNARIAELEGQMPAAYLTALRTQQRDGNLMQQFRLTDTYLKNHAEAVEAAYRVRLTEWLGYGPTDGAPAWETALLWAQAARAHAPSDTELTALTADLRSASAAAASGAKVTLKSAEDRAERHAAAERLPQDLDALTRAFVSSRDRGEYRLMLEIARHGQKLARSLAGVDSKPHLLFQRRMAEAQLLCGDVAGALAQYRALVPKFEASPQLGGMDPATLYLKHEVAACLTESGDFKTALGDLRILLPILEKVFGAEHINTLSARLQFAMCLRGSCDPAGALDALHALLPVMEKTLGAQHKHTLRTRSSIAVCLHQTGDSPAALTEFRAVLPLEQAALGAQHPNVLNTRIYFAKALATLPDQAEARQMLSGVRQGLEGAGLLPQHQFFARLAEVEQMLTPS